MSEGCEIPLSNASSQEIVDILKEAKTIAVVGISAKPERDSNRVASYLKSQGYKIIPVNPTLDEVLGEKAYGSLKDIPEKVDVVDIFRKPEAIPGVVDEAIGIGAGTVWMQEGLAHNESAGKAREKGMKVVMSKCIKKEHMAAFK